MLGWCRLIQAPLKVLPQVELKNPAHRHRHVLYPSPRPNFIPKDEPPTVRVRLMHRLRHNEGVRDYERRASFSILVSSMPWNMAW
jgi:hypothetical protein